MTDVKDKIAKLLALAGNNPNENEAKAAILRARALMAEHKLRPEECAHEQRSQVVKKVVGVSCTARKYSWGVNLAGILAQHYCCLCFRSHSKGSQTQEIGFVGLDDDYDICSRMFRYAFETAKRRSEEIFRENADWESGPSRRKRAEAYGYGFCAGLEEALDKQQDEHQEWGLVMVVPPQVQAVFAGQKPSSYSKENIRSSAEWRARSEGYQDGLKFDPSTKLAEAKTPFGFV